MTYLMEYPGGTLMAYEDGSLMGYSDGSFPAGAPTLIDQTTISQYANSPTITQLLYNMGEYLDPRLNIDDFFDFVWNVETAQGFGLDIWGRIVGVGRFLTITTGVEDFGFKEGNVGVSSPPYMHPFNQRPFYDGLTPATQTYALTDTAYRKLIMAKALANISDVTARSINQLLQNLFPDRGVCYVSDLGGMAIQYVFEFELTSYEFAIMTQSGVLPRPAGVSASLTAVNVTPFTF